LPVSKPKSPKTLVNKPEYFNLSDKLKQEKKITSEFEIMLNTLTLEDIIGLKIELTARTTKSKFYAFKVWQAMPYIAREALLMYIYKHSPTVAEAAAMLGVSDTDYYHILYRYGIQEKYKKSLTETDSEL
jgi:hypothetical protein